MDHSVLPVHPPFNFVGHTLNREPFRSQIVEAMLNIIQSPVNRELSLMARVLLHFCRRPDTPDYPMSGVHYESGKELDRLEEVFPDFRREVNGKFVVDFGCGEGYQAVAMARSGASSVLGVEIDGRLLSLGEKRVHDMRLENVVKFTREMSDTVKADVIVSQNSFEHFIGAAAILDAMRKALAPNGRIFVTFAPPWYAPWGAHMAFFCRLPWVQLLFPERTVMEVRSLFRADRARTYQEAGLAEMSVGKFEKLVANSGLAFDSKRYDYIRGMRWLRHFPVRELMINRVSCVLRPA